MSRPGHRWTPWKYDHGRRRWFRHCVIGAGNCAAVESVPRGQKPSTARRLTEENPDA